MTTEPSKVLREPSEAQPQDELQTPLIDEWMTKWPGRASDSVQIHCRFPERLWVHDVQDTLIEVRLGQVTFVHKPADMRLLLLAAVEWLDIRIAESRVS